MRKIIVSEFVSLDNVIEGPGPGDSFEYAGWTMPYTNEAIGKIKFDEVFGAGAMLMGRVTYDIFAAFWPKMTDEFGQAMNNMKKYVVSKNLEKADWNNTEIISEDIFETIAKLKDEPGKDILVLGSSELVKGLMEQGLVDEFKLLVYPVVLGKGKRLFKDGARADMELTDSKAFDSGVVLLDYRSAKKR